MTFTASNNVAKYNEFFFAVGKYAIPLESLRNVSLNMFCLQSYFYVLSSDMHELHLCLLIHEKLLQFHESL